MSFSSFVISSGHSKYVAGAVNILNEVTEARRVVDRVTAVLQVRNVSVKKFHDDTSKNQSDNLHTIVAYHNAQKRDLDVSVHFNAGQAPSDAPRGTECLFLSQEALAREMSANIASCGLKNRGPKHRTDLYFLNATNEPAILIEVCFVDSTEDAAIYQREFNNICDCIAKTLLGVVQLQPEAIAKAVVTLDLTVPENVQVRLSVNGQYVM